MLKTLCTCLLFLSILLGDSFKFILKNTAVAWQLAWTPQSLSDQLRFAFIRAQAQMGSSQAQWTWAKALLAHHPSEGQEKTAVDLLKQAALQGERGAMRDLVTLYEQGGRLAKNAEEVLRWSRLLAESDDLEGQYYLGLRLILGQGLPQDFEEGYKWLTLAAESGHSGAQVALGGFFWTGYEPLPFDEKRAADWYELAAHAGHTVGKRMLGLVYRDGRGREQNAELAVEWLKQAALSGDVKSKFFLGECYLKGVGVPEDAETAFSWLLRAAEAGDEDAQVLVAGQLLEGHGVSQNAMAGISYLFRAAIKGSMLAQYRLGKLFAEGEHVGLDEGQATKWLESAAEQGHEDARLLLDWLQYGVLVQVQRSPG